MQAFLRVFTRRKKSARSQGTQEEWEDLEKSTAAYDVDSDVEEVGKDLDAKSYSDGSITGVEEVEDKNNPIDPTLDEEQVEEDERIIDDYEDRTALAMNADADDDD